MPGDARGTGEQYLCGYQGGARSAPRAGACARPRPWGPGRRAPALTLSLSLLSQAHSAVRPLLARCHLPRRSIVQLAATASRALSAVASHAISCADPGPGAHSRGIGASRGRRADQEPAKDEAGACRCLARTKRGFGHLSAGSERVGYGGETTLLGGEPGLPPGAIALVTVHPCKYGR